MGVVAYFVAFLDALPDMGRGLLGALLLLGLLLLFDLWLSRAPATSPATTESGRRERFRQSFGGYRWRIAHVKTSLLALLLVPVAITLLPAFRMPVYVDELPQTASGSTSVMSLLLGVWLLIALALAVRTVLRWREHPQSLWPDGDEASAAILAAQFDDAPEAMVTRQRHWQRRLGYERVVKVRIGPVSEPTSLEWRTRVIDLPHASAHWPAAATDVALIVQLCHLSLNHHRWLRFAALLGCLYWPFTFVRRTLPARLARDFERAAQELAQSCYRDPLGYQRAEKQLLDRLDKKPATAPAARAAGAIHPRAGDPYGRVFLIFAQALLIVYVLTGTTLKEIPDDSNFRYADFVDDWYETFQRSIKYAEEG